MQNKTILKIEIILITLVLVTLGIYTKPAMATEYAKVNGTAITDKQVNQALANLSEVQRKSFLKDTNNRKQVVQSLIEQEILFQEGEKLKLDQDNTYKEALEAFRRQFLVTQAVSKYVGEKLTDEAVKKFYNTYQSRYSTDVVRAQHILVETESKAKDLLNKARSPGADFQKLAESNSKDPSVKSNRGDLGYFGRDRMVPEFTNAAFNGKPGDIVGPVKTSYGYHLIKIIEKKMGSVLPLKEVDAKVRADLRNELIQSYVDQLKQTANVVVEGATVK